ncbi:MAG: hypothetical protein ACTS43_01815 [Candidatus Hodgkinia cicadicola]
MVPVRLEDDGVKRSKRSAEVHVTSVWFGETEEVGERETEVSISIMREGDFRDN